MDEQAMLLGIDARRGVMVAEIQKMEPRWRNDPYRILMGSQCR